MPETKPPAPVFHVGHAAAEGMGGGWFVGQFVPASLGARHQTEVELKWGVHPRGERRPGGMVAYSDATTISVLVSGAFRMTAVLEGAAQVHTLDRPGDYVIFGPDIPHEWETLEDAVVLSIRYPSRERGRPIAAGGGPGRPP